MTLGIDPKVDYAFKWLFGSEKNTGILIHLLHSILNPAPEEQIVHVEILNPFNDRMALDEKLSILDVKARDQLGRQFNVEMQMLATPGLRQRILFYWAELYTGQLRKGEDYELSRPTISVCFVDGILFPAISEHHLVFRLMEPTQGVVLTDDLAIHFFELPKFGLSAEELATPLETWLYFLRNAEDLDPEALPAPLDTVEMRQAVEALTMLTFVDIHKEIYEGRIKARRDERMWRIDALKEGRAEGIVEGRAEGIVEGRAEGILIGRIETLQKLMRRETTPRAELEAMPIEELEGLAAQLEREAAG